MSEANKGRRRAAANDNAAPSPPDGIAASRSLRIVSALDAATPITETEFLMVETYLASIIARLAGPLHAANENDRGVAEGDTVNRTGE